MIKFDQSMQTANSVQLSVIMLSQRRNLKKAAILMVSISLFSLFPLLIPFVLQFCTSSLSFNPFFNYSSERNYMFLFCNGILAFVIKNSVFSADSHVGISSDHPIVSHDEEEIAKKKTGQGFAQEYRNHPEMEMKNEFLMAEEQGQEQEQEDEDEDEDEDELNKKCEDFIRRMKQGIRIEATQEMVLNENRRNTYFLNQ